MATKLDKKRPFGTIMGDLEGRAYEQDNKFFRADGSEWEDPKAKKPAAPAKKGAVQAKAEEQPKQDPVDDQLNDQLQGQ